MGARFDSVDWVGRRALIAVATSLGAACAAAGGPDKVSQRWVYGTDAAKPSAPYFSVNTPVEAASGEQCGRLVHTGIHVAKANMEEGTDPFPGICVSAPLSAQEKAMEFLLFDLSSCVTDNDRPPEPPPIIN
ncbi:hypothetical protein WMF38_48870 [Sorangium sp. So ce118]